MTDVIEPTTSTPTWKSVNGVSDVNIAVSNLASPPSLRVIKDVSRPATGQAHRTRLRSLSRVRAWMVVPVVDFALMMAPLLWRPPQPTSLFTMAVLATLLLTGGGRYVARLHLSVLDELPYLITRLLTAVAAVSTIILWLHQKAAVLVFLETACQAVALVIVGRVITTRVLAIARKRGIAQHRTILIGGGPLAAELARILAEHREYGITLDGFVDDNVSCQAEDYLPRLGSLADLDVVAAESGAEILLIADGSFEEHKLMDAVRTRACQHTELLVVPRMHHFHTLTGMADHIGSIPIMRIRNPNLRGPARLIKRAFDIAVAATALIVLSPVLAVAALAVLMEGGPGIIFRQIRVGRDGKHFELLKFRSMRPANEQESQTQWSVATDNRVGPVGRFLRRTSIDELPQLWNILRGDMTVVGPRPERPHFVEQFSTQFDRYAHRHRVQVGLTGFAQVSGLRGDTSIADRARYDNFYIENWSLWLDLTIIFRTFREVLFYRGR
ncbi:sugar transferase [Mycolicibacterium hippocampi]|uniref:UDP-phosphate galactose phosphotransferase n=1 Tax=Mycolicibacterium hippocampi TaxID=659824 RepID=A0A7I9ZM62_9MYCO|nr:sugar transferase [Mycolicibacterium hippocampi]GFH01943.1 UDP-phosphate galactose phosphotransferase [Mycolicibacterium hippocampi]